jgi:predicted Zn-dependent protease
VNARHTAERSSKGMLTSVLLAGATIATSAAGYGGTAGLIQEFGQVGAGALLAHYSRDNEREADALGMEYMTRTGYNPSGMVGLMDILLKKNERDPSALELMFSTHPMSRERYTTARQRAETDYQNMVSAPVNKERYMDMTASIRRDKDGILTLQKGSELMASKKYQEAEATFHQALKKMPGDYTANVLMAKCQFAQKKTKKAAQYATTATQIYPQEAQAHAILGVSSIVNKQYSQALGSFNQFDRLLPGNPEITFFKGLSQEGMGQKNDAAKNYNAYLQKVRQGQRAQYAYNKLKSWGYVR